MRVDAAFEGGGVRGIAFLGAIEEMEKAGFTWGDLAGTSAGSIIAALLAVGYSSGELLKLFLQFPFQDIEKRTDICKIPYIGPWLSLQLFNGIYTSDVIETWLGKHLKAKGVCTFSDLPDRKLRIIVTDLTKNRMTVLPDDLALYNVRPEDIPVARAIRMSCSIPFILRPVRLAGSVIVDGGVLSNFPLWLFDKTERPTWPIFGFRLSGCSPIAPSKEIRGPIDLSVSLIRTLMDGHDNRFIDSHSASRTIFIKGITVGVTAFNLSMEEKMQLVDLGRGAAREFLSKWNLKRYLHEQRPVARVVQIK